MSKKWLKRLGHIGAGIATGGISELAYQGYKNRHKVSDLLFGKKDPGPPEEFTAAQSSARAAQKAGLKALQDSINRVPPEQRARMETQQSIRGMQAGAEDARRQLQSMIAQRGLHRSSIGIGQQTGLNRELAERSTMALAQQPLLAEQIRRQNAMDLMNAGSGMLSNQGTIFQGGGRSGGLLSPLLGGAGAIGGGLMGGPMGAMTGWQVGSGMGQGLQGLGGGQQRYY